MKKIIFIVFLSMTFVAQHLAAQQIFKVTRSTFGNGGGYCSNDNYQLNGTVSQSFIGLTQNNQHQGHIGFWYRGKDHMTTSTKTLVDQRGSGYLLKQNEPNPFSQITRIKLTIPETSKVRLTVVDAFGKEVERLVDKRMSPGNHEIPFDAQALRSGVYFYQLQTDHFSETHQMILVR